MNEAINKNSQNRKKNMFMAPLEARRITCKHHKCTPLSSIWQLTFWQLYSSDDCNDDKKATTFN
jgi:hypothetical protein